ncbi:hypothetical protein [Azospirillum endophyticum]
MLVPVVVTCGLKLSGLASEQNTRVLSADAGPAAVNPKNSVETATPFARICIGFLGDRDIQCSSED